MAHHIPSAHPNDIDFFSRNAYTHVYSDYGTILSDLCVILQNARSQLYNNTEICDETLLIAQMLCSKYSISLKLDRDYYYVVFRSAIRCDTLFMGTCCTDFNGVRPVDLFIYILRHIDVALTSQALCEAV